MHYYCMGRFSELTRANLSRETKFSGTDGDREERVYHCPVNHEQDW